MMRQDLSPRATLAIAWIMSAGVFGIGSFPLILAAEDEYPWGFAVGIAACFWTLAVWNVKALPRVSEIPAGRWLIVLSVLCLVTGLLGVASSYVGLGALVGATGCAGLIASWRASRRLT